MKTKKRDTNVIFILMVSIVILLSLYFLQKLVMPKYMSDVVEGAMIAEYYEEEKNHDVIFIGDCEVYDSFIPAVLWEEYGISSYIRGSAQQLIWQSYYILEETLQYETPDVVVFNVLSLKYNVPQKESYNRMTLDGMKFSPSKLKAIKDSMLEEEEFLDYVFPILRYHSRITKLKKEDFVYLFQKNKVTHNGYYMRVDVTPATYIPEGRPLGDYSFGENALLYLNQMVQLCKEQDIPLILVKAPSLYPYWYEEWEVQVEQFAKEHKLTYINFLELIEECGIDYTTDTYDAGLHLNLSGAEKVTKWFGQFLQKKCGLESRKDDENLVAIWDKKLEKYYTDKEKKTNEWLNTLNE
mgnify:CR=1 FL=1